MANKSIVIRERMARAMLHAIDLPNTGRLCAEGAEMNIPLVGVPTRLIVNVSVLPWVGLRVGGVKSQVSQLGSAVLVSAFWQEKVIGAEKPLAFTVTVKFAVVFEAVRFAEFGETDPVGKFVFAKLISATALPLAWFTQTMSGVEFASTPIWTVPQVDISGVVGSAPLPAGGGSFSKHKTDGLADTCATVGKVTPLSVERAKNTLNTLLPLLIAAVGCSHATFTLPLASTATCGKADAKAPEGAILVAGQSGIWPGAQLVKVPPPSSERLRNIPSAFELGVASPDQTT
jgi:hypothetical protein